MCRAGESRHDNMKRPLLEGSATVHVIIVTRGVMVLVVCRARTADVHDLIWLSWQLGRNHAKF